MNREQKQYLLEQIDIVDDIGQISDGYHTFNSLYMQRLYLFAALVNAFPNKSWKSKKHEDGEPCFGGGWFLVCIETPQGPYSYHYKLEDWDLFHCKEIDTALPFDGHTDADVPRVLSLGRKHKYVPMESKRKKWGKQWWNGHKVEVTVEDVNVDETSSE